MYFSETCQYHFFRSIWKKQLLISSDSSHSRFEKKSRNLFHDNHVREDSTDDVEYKNNQDMNTDMEEDGMQLSHTPAGSLIIKRGNKCYNDPDINIITLYRSYIPNQNHNN